MTHTFDTIDKADLEALLLRNWMTHDAMWFAHSVGELGIERANALNRSAVRGMAAVEAKRLRRLLGIEQIRTPRELRRVFEAVRELTIPDFIEFTWDWSDDDRALRFEITKCFAFEGVSQLGVAESYQCGIYERVYGWLDALGVAFEVAPDVTHCTMHHDGRCVREFRLSFPRGAAGA